MKLIDFLERYVFVNSEEEEEEDDSSKREDKR